MEGLFVVKVIGCNLTRDTEVFGKMDPYCLLKTGDQKAMTSVKIDAGKVCTWNETFTFYVKQDDVLKFQVFDEDPGTDDLVGESFLNVGSSFLEKKSFTFALTYADKGAGTLDMELQFFPQDRKKIEDVKRIQSLIREKQLLIEKYLKEEHKDVEIINSANDDQREKELKRAIELDKIEILGLENQFKELFVQYDKELAGLNHTLSGLMKENAKLKETIASTNAKLDEYRKPLPGGLIELLVKKATITRDVEVLGESMDPFVIFFLGKSKAETTVAKSQGKHPNWNQNLKLERVDEEILRFEVIDYNSVMKSQSIGYGSLSLFEVIHSKGSKPMNSFLYYKGERVGTIDYEIQFIKK